MQNIFSANKFSYWIYPLLIGLSLICITRNFPVKESSSFILVFFVMAIFVSYKSLLNNFQSARSFIKIIGICYILASTFLLEYSIIQGNNFAYAINTYGTIILLLMSYFLKRDFRIIKVFIAVLLLHSLILIGIEIFMSINSDISFNSGIRAFFRENEYGDIYTLDGIFFRILVKGNELLPIAFMISQFIYRKRTKIITSAIFFIGIMISGNFAYYLSLGIFYISYLIYKKKYRICFMMIVSLLIGLIFFSSMFGEYLESKNEYSFPTRIDQFNVLINDMGSINDFLLGKGLGNIINESTSFRNYSACRYFELQTVYFFNQLGFIFFILFVFSHFILALEYMNEIRILMMYFCYLCYAVTNPYIWNFDHIFVIIILLTLKDYLKEETSNKRKNKFEKENSITIQC